MDKALMEKFVDMIRTDLTPLSLTKEFGEEKLIMSFRYNKEKDVIIYEKAVRNKNDRRVDSAVVEDIETLASIIEGNSLIEEMVNCVHKRQEKERKYQEVREEMLSQLDTMGLNDQQKATMLSVIEKTTQLSEHVGMGNRVPLVNTPDYWEHVRVAGPNKWSDEGDKLHLQLVQAMEDPIGRKHHNYPVLSFEELVGKILSSPLMTVYVSQDKKL